MSLDRTDFKILAELQKNARISNKELATKLGLAPSSTHQRMKALLEKKIIRGFYADIDLSALGMKLQAFVSIQLKRHSKNAFKKMHAYFESLPEVLAVYHVSGKDDLIVHIVVRDSEELKNLILDRFVTHDEGFRCETSIIYSHSHHPSLPREQA